jgi:hypothetical protein
VADFSRADLASTGLDGLVYPSVQHKSGDAAAAESPRRLPQVPLPDEDPRDATLRLDTTKLEVRHIKAVSFVTESYPVTRHRSRREHFKFPPSSGR